MLRPCDERGEHPSKEHRHDTTLKSLVARLAAGGLPDRGRVREHRRVHELEQEPGQRQ